MGETNAFLRPPQRLLVQKESEMPTQSTRPEGGHYHPHEHSHHPHGHGHAPSNFNRAFAIGIGLNMVFVAIEAFYGWQVNSLALLADAAHNLSDVAGLVLAWMGALASQLKPNAKHTYGWQRGTILAALINAVLLLVAMGSLGWEALQRLQTPEAIEGWTVIGVAAVGIVVNSLTAWLFMKDQHDLNIRGAFLHMAADALVSLGVVLGGILYLYQGWTWLDPVMSLLIAVIIVMGTWGLFQQSVHLLFDGVPPHVNLEQVRDCLSALPGIVSIHDLHVWALSTSKVALTAHLVVADTGTDTSMLLATAQEELEEHFHIKHVTLQLESSAFAHGCRLSGHAEHDH